MQTSLPREGEFAGGVTLLQGSHLAVLYDELPNVIRELRGPELEALDGDQLLGRSTGKGERKTSAGLVEHLEFDLGRSHVISRQFFEQRRVQRLGLAREHDFTLIQRDHRTIDVSLRVRPEVKGELAILLVIRRVKTVVMEVAHRKLEFVKAELQRVTFEPDFEDAIGRILMVGC